LALAAVTGFLLPVALIGLAGLLLAAGAGLALLREGPMWPRRPGRLAYAAYLVLPPALEVGLIVTSAAGLGAALRVPARRPVRRFGGPRRPTRPAGRSPTRLAPGGGGTGSTARPGAGCADRPGLVGWSPGSGGDRPSLPRALPPRGTAAPRRCAPRCARRPGAG